MPEFILDTAGSVEKLVGVPPVPQSPSQVYGWIIWGNLDAFTQGYIEALFFTENEPGTTRSDRNRAPKRWAKRVEEGQQKDMPGDFGFRDLAPEALATIMRDCEHFQADAKVAALIQGREAKAGRDFWYTRNGHGCGFWDGDWDDVNPGEILDLRAKTFREVDVYLGANDLVHVS